MGIHLNPNIVSARAPSLSAKLYKVGNLILWGHRMSPTRWKQAQISEAGNSEVAESIFLPSYFPHVHTRHFLNGTEVTVETLGMSIELCRFVSKVCIYVEGVCDRY